MITSLLQRTGSIRVELGLRWKVCCRPNNEVLHVYSALSVDLLDGLCSTTPINENTCMHVYCNKRCIASLSQSTSQNIKAGDFFPCILPLWRFVTEGGFIFKKSVLKAFVAVFSSFQCDFQQEQNETKCIQRKNGVLFLVNYDKTCRWLETRLRTLLIVGYTSAPLTQM